ncbi:MAG: hypothetical protein Q8O94_02670 [bacterium]|nr:hypothetical protein [bacterium]
MKYELTDLPANQQALVQAIQGQGLLVKEAVKSGAIYNDIESVRELYCRVFEASRIPVLERWAREFYNHYAQYVSSVAGIRIIEIADPNGWKQKFMAIATLAGSALLKSK